MLGYMGMLFTGGTIFDDYYIVSGFGFFEFDKIFG
jgi:hypothetical protein